MKIISGGQTGVDRAALDVALDHGIACGGWCPAGRSDEFGRIPDRYPVMELDGGGPAERTLQNVIDSDGTIVFYQGSLGGGTKYTVQCCVEHHRPHELINAKAVSTAEAAELVLEFVRLNRIEVLNIAGPRQSEWPAGYAFAAATLEDFFQRLDP